MKVVWIICFIGIMAVIILSCGGWCRSTDTFYEGIGGGRGGGGRGGGGRGGGGRGGGGRGGGGRGGGGRGGRGGGHRGGHGHHGHHHGRGGRGWGGWGSGWGSGWWWPSWYYDPYYYVPLSYDIDEDPCDCFGKYKAMMDARVNKDVAGKALEECVRRTLAGSPCM